MKKENILFVILFILSFALPQIVFSQEKEYNTEVDGLVKWLDINEALEKNKQTPKPFLFDFYTGWCGWCKHMMRTTYSNPAIASYINAYFYPIKFNAEGKDTLVFTENYFKDTIYEPISEGRSVHPFAYEVMDGKLSYPTTIFYDSQLKFKMVYNGYIDVMKIEPLLVFFNEHIYSVCDYDKFKDMYFQANDTSYKDSIPVKWYSLNEAIELSQKNKRKILIVIYTNWCNSCKVMIESTYSEPSIAKYLNDSAYLVKFDANSNDTVNFHGRTFINQPGSPSNFHDFALYVTQNNVALPTNLFLDEDQRMITPVPQFMTSETIEPILRFFIGDHYKNVKWEDFRSTFVSEIKTE